MRRSDPASRRVLFVAGALGFVAWMLGFADWQVAVETAQVIAGRVVYAADNPFYLYHVGLWSVLHEIAALLLNAGLSEITLSMILSGLIGMVILQALALFVYTISGDVVVAIGAACAIVVSRAAQYGVIYPISLTTTSHTYGAIGLPLVVLAVALFASGRHRAGGFLIGFLPAVHASLGVWLVVILLLCAAARPALWREPMRQSLPFVAAGCALAVAGFAVHFTVTAGGAAAVPDESGRYVAAFVRFWDGHRQPVDIGRKGGSLNIAALIVSIGWLRLRGAQLSRGGALLLSFTAVSATLSLALAVVSWIPVEYLPSWGLLLMPSRLLNICAMTFVALLFGLAAERRDRWGHAIAAFLIFGLLVSDRSMLWDLLRSAGFADAWIQIPQLAIPAVALLGLAIAAFSPDNRRDPGKTLPPAPTDAMRSVRRVSTAMSASAVMLLVALAAQRAMTVRRDVFRDRTNDAFYAEVARGGGTLLTGGDLHLVQLRTRRPVLIDGGGLDGLVYAPAAGPAMAGILRDVYGIDLLDPPEEARGYGVIPRAPNQRAWESYDTGGWRRIREQYGVTQVLTFDDWRLDLPIVARGHALVLYAIPSEFKP